MSAVFRRRFVGETPRNVCYCDTAYTLYWQVSDHVDILKPILFRLYPNKTINLRPPPYFHTLRHVIPTKWRSYLEHRFYDVTSHYV